MEERSLRIIGADRNFFNRITTTLTKILTPTRVGINNMLISVRRNSMLKAFDAFQEADESFRDEEEERYKASYENYLMALDKYVMDSIYKKVKSDTASQYEKNALAKYYEVITLKENEYVEYKYRKQKYLIDLDYEGVKQTKKEKLIERFKQFYAYKMDVLYKGILKNYSIKLADTSNVYDTTKDWLYSKIFLTLEDYTTNILPLRLKEDKKLKKVVPEYEKFEEYTIGKLDGRDNIEKNKILIGMSRFLFTHSLPLVVAEQCYERLLKDARTLLQDTKIATKREKVYTTLIDLIEDYNVKLLSKKVYWENQEDKNRYKKFWKQYKEISKIKQKDFVEYVREKEVLFIKQDLRRLDLYGKLDYSKIEKYYKRKLVDYGEMRVIRNTFRSEGNYKKVKEVA